MNKPAAGTISGTIFSDGSGSFPRHPALRRAGWALVMTNEHGQLLSACFGAVPFDLAPMQTSRDGEDYAIFMLSFVAEPPFTVSVIAPARSGACRWAAGRRHCKARERICGRGSMRRSTASRRKL